MNFSHLCQKIASVPWFLQLLWLLFVHHFADIAAPLYASLFKEVFYHCTNAENSFYALYAH